MKTKTLFPIVTCVSLLLVQGRGSGVSKANGRDNFSKRIFYGELANPADFPFVVHLYDPLIYSGQLCGGSVISKHFILTAAHCLDDEECTNIQISPSTWIPGDEPKFRAAFCHPLESFINGSFLDDIGLVETTEDLLEDGTFQAIPLPDPGRIYVPGDSATILGWGKKEDGSYPAHLWRAEVSVYDWDECNVDFQNADSCADDMSCPAVEIPSSAFCVKSEPPNPPGFCIGDSGGPAIIDGRIAGLLSGLIVLDDLCVLGSPSLLTNVADYLPWITSYIEIDDDRK